MPSPIIEGDYFLVTSDSGVAHCYEAKTGNLMWAERLGEQHASLVSARGRVYFLNDKGVMNVVKPGPNFVREAQNEIGESCFASPALRRFLLGAFVGFLETVGLAIEPQDFSMMDEAIDK